MYSHIQRLVYIHKTSYFLVYGMSYDFAPYIKFHHFSLHIGFWRAVTVAGPWISNVMPALLLVLELIELLSWISVVNFSSSGILAQLDLEKAYEACEALEAHACNFRSMISELWGTGTFLQSGIEWRSFRRWVRMSGTSRISRMTKGVTYGVLRIVLVHECLKYTRKLKFLTGYGVGSYS